MNAANHLIQNAVQVRWLTADDLPAVVGIEAAAFAATGECWTEKKLQKALKADNTLHLAAETASGVVGYLIAVVGDDTFGLSRLVVHPAHRRMRELWCWDGNRQSYETVRGGVGTALVRHVQQKMRGRSAIVACVRERDMGAILFLKHLEFLATSVDRDLFGEGEDGYRMEWLA
jgi:ribosomal protein S18 acetylase RimI-like enzyme